VDVPTMNISLPESLKAFVEEQVASRGYASASEYFRELVRRERDVQRLRGLIDEGALSGTGPVVGPDYWQELDRLIASHSHPE